MKQWKTKVTSLRVEWSRLRRCRNNNNQWRQPSICVLRYARQWENLRRASNRGSHRKSRYQACWWRDNVRIDRTFNLRRNRRTPDIFWWHYHGESRAQTDESRRFCEQGEMWENEYGGEGSRKRVRPSHSRPLGFQALLQQPGSGWVWRHCHCCKRRHTLLARKKTDWRRKECVPWVRSKS